jgi:phosphoglycerate dehydrogenase-like enzyme
MAWLEARHSVLYRPQLAHDERALRHSTDKVRSIVLPNRVLVNQEFLEFAPCLEVIVRMQVGTDNIDLEACRDRNIKVLQARNANVRANAEFLVGSLLLLYRQGILAALRPAPLPTHTPNTHPSKVHAPAPMMGREINGSTIGLLGIGPAAGVLAALLTSMGARLIGYDPALHHSSPIWQQMRVQPVSLVDMMSTADAVSVQMLYASRFKGFINARVLASCKPQQLWASISRGALFDAAAMAQAMQDGRIGAWLTDSADEGDSQALQLLRTLPTFYATQRIGSTTRESRQRASWYIAHRLHDALNPEDAHRDASGSRSMSLSLPGETNPSSWIESAPPIPTTAPPTK